jgi:RND family efflux transporter MFP subunit
MSDRLVISLATLPMISGVLLVGLLQRADPAQAASKKRPAETLVATVGPHEARPGNWVGVVSAGSNADLAAEFDGRVTHVFVKSGQQVKQGDRLLEIDQAEAATTVGVAGAELGQNQSDVLSAEARLEAAKLKASRLEEGGKWLSATELDGARTEVRIAQAELAAARSKVAMGRAKLAQQRLRANKHTLVAPFTGTLVSIDVDAGDSVTAGQVLARVISDERVIRFALPRAELAEQPLTEVLVRLKDRQEAALRAPVNAVRPEVDAAAQLVFATANLPEEVRSLPSWMPGSIVEVQPLPPAQNPELPAAQR